jgi:hypothetical protein
VAIEFTTISFPVEGGPFDGKEMQANGFRVDGGPLCAMSFVLIFLSDLIERRYGGAVECGVLLVVVLTLLTVVINRDWK